MPTTIYEYAREFRKKLLARETRATQEILRAYQNLILRLDPVIAVLLAEIAERAAGSEGKVLSLLHYQILQAQATKELQRLSAELETITRNLQIENAGAARAESARLITLSVKSNLSPRLPTAAIENFIGLAGDGSALEQLFRSVHAAAPELVKTAILNGIALGQPPQRTAADIRKSFGAAAARSLTIARTETLRTYRETARQIYLLNSEIVSGWRWIAALTPRTCRLCWARHGKIYPLDKPMPAHPNCRCVVIPVLDKDESFITGAEKFAGLEKGYQKQILGASRFALYETGRIGLEDVVGERHSPRWGALVREKSIKELVDQNS